MLKSDIVKEFGPSKYNVYLRDVNGDNLARLYHVDKLDENNEVKNKIRYDLRRTNIFNNYSDGTSKSLTMYIDPETQEENIADSEQDVISSMRNHPNLDSTQKFIKNKIKKLSNLSNHTGIEDDLAEYSAADMIITTLKDVDSKSMGVTHIIDTVSDRLSKDIRSNTEHPMYEFQKYKADDELYAIYAKKYVPKALEGLSNLIDDSVMQNMFSTSMKTMWKSVGDLSEFSDFVILKDVDTLSDYLTRIC